MRFYSIAFTIYGKLDDIVRLTICRSSLRLNDPSRFPNFDEIPKTEERAKPPLPVRKLIVWSSEYSYSGRNSRRVENETARFCLYLERTRRQNQLLGIGVPWSVDDLLRPSRLDDSAPVHHDDPMREGARDGNVVGDE
jgi:hypothetical protein